MKFSKAVIGLILCLMILSSCSAKKANIEEAVMTSDVDRSGKNTDYIDIYKPDADIFTVAAKLTDAPNDTVINIRWVYATENQDIDSVAFKGGGTRYINSTLSRGKSLWPSGDYKVLFYINDNKEPSAVVAFKVSDDI